MRTELVRASVSGPEALVSLAEQASDDLRAAGKIVGDLSFTATDADELTAAAEIAAQG